MTLNIAPKACASTDAAFAHSYFASLERLASLRLGTAPEAWAAWAAPYAPGAVVDVVHADKGALKIAGLDDVTVAQLPRDLASSAAAPKAAKAGAKAKAVIVDVDAANRRLVVSLRPEFVSARAQPKARAHFVCCFF